MRSLIRMSALVAGVATAGLATAAGMQPAVPGFTRETAAKLAPAVQRELPNGKLRSYIVQLREPVTSGDYDALRDTGARITRRYGRLPMAAVVASPRVVSR